ncbi:hypothetical protein PanWU01x14_289610 [Parasponia andersonii]|uniref:Uncharacterized protein n=1 Tax=Parasponia andersonii TaxID=3476 RepID=A0A2P5AY49_PARAD|nr:hypothetical protein PanWU01x14_289610 [Parasponia andersonii]
MLKVTWTVPYSSRRRSSSLSGIHREVSASHHVSIFSVQNKGVNANQLGLLLSLRNRSNAKMDKIVCNSVEPGASCGGGAPWNTWQGLVFGVVVTLILPFWRSKWGPLLAFKNKVDSVVDSVEAVAEVVEKVAEKVEDIADDIADKLPENGKLKDAVLLIEKIAKETAKDAHLVDEFIEKVEGVEEKVESLFDNVPEDQAAKEEPKNVEEDQATKEEPKNVEDKVAKVLETKNDDQPTNT